MTEREERPWLHRTDFLLHPDPARVVARTFLPGQELPAGPSRSTEVLERVLALTDAEVAGELDDLVARFGEHHRDIEMTWDANFALVEHRIDGGHRPSAQRRRLIGASFTHEYSIEGAALFNPSMTVHPDQRGTEPGSTRFVMTLRAVGEGHISSIEMRTGVIGPDDLLTFDAAPTATALAVAAPTRWSREAFELQLDDMWGDHTDSDFMLSLLPSVFDRADLDRALTSLQDQHVTRASSALAIDRFELLAACSYTVEFAPASDIQERVLMPRGPSEVQGMEDVRIARFYGHSGEPRYLGTYTAYDGVRVSSQLLSTEDFRRFTVMPLTGPGSRNKGLAIFPRPIGGRYAAMSRADRENNAVTWSDDVFHWSEGEVVQTPTEPWEIIQLGNCGPPIETDEGWLVLTHGVGPMRQYSIGALLLHLEDPTVVLGRLTRPLLAPQDEVRSGYVPNVVYSCGSMLHGETLVVPYGCNDSTTRIAMVSVPGLISELKAVPRRGGAPTTKDRA